MNNTQTQLLIQLRREVVALRKVVAVLRRELIKTNLRLAQIELSEKLTDSQSPDGLDEFYSEPAEPEA